MKGIDLQEIGAAIEAPTGYNESCIKAVDGLMDKYGAKVVSDSLQIALMRKVYFLQREVDTLQRRADGVEMSGKKVI